MMFCTACCTIFSKTFMSIIRISRPKSFSTQLARKRESLDVSFNVVLQIPNTLGSLTTKSTFVQSIRALLYMLIDCIFHFTDILRLPRFDVVHGFLGVLGVYVATQRLLCGEPPWLGAVRALEPGKMVECSPALVCCHVSLVGGEVLLPVVNSLALVAPLPLRPVGPQPLQPAVVAAAAVAVLLMVVEPEAGGNTFPQLPHLGFTNHKQCLDIFWFRDGLRIVGFIHRFMRRRGAFFLFLQCIISHHSSLQILFELLFPSLPS